MPLPTDDVVTALTEALPGRVESEATNIAEFTVDRSGHESAGLPLIAVYPESIEEVQTVCRIASETNTPIVTRGAGTGLAGGAVAGPGEIVLSLMRMNRILKISQDNRLAVVQPGILNGALNAALQEHGMWWAPDPASKDISTVGGNVAMNAGGLLCAKYGVTREAVLALKVVLGDGRLIEVGHRTVKGVTGYDLCALMIGSEGTLGVIVECTLKLQPLVVGETVTLGAYFERLEDAAAGAAAITRDGLVPAIMELVDLRTLEALDDFFGESISRGSDAYLLVQCDGPDSHATAARVAELLTMPGSIVETTTDPVESARLVNIRRNAFPALEAKGTLLIEDIAVPRDQTVAAFSAIREIEAKYDVIIATSCHAGDGNLHPTFVFQGEEVPVHIWEAASEVFALALKLGGTLSGEHGIGLLKRRWLKDELGQDQFDLQRQIKAVFDPQGLLNPGKVF
ncbi:FAD-binding oxidoreductase [Gulosibacter molinativorax]|uniref:FAD-binding protein n=1 Tax=Gulosibacter molinativorax TaxID=256821 RepID=A0ABT7CAH3_9MICO|nr:FAD-linked oxidase C-terminal domain-containing protein [Gulosibacter molinativorax]MDJ1372152.1 FAD-binding protein [Gulosibacter molinativorax]QUY60977.1 FAD binding domain protein [Gulosibacter molinativorax]